MARQPRDDAPGVAHHVMARGIERRPLFRDDADREDFLQRLSRLAPELGFRCFAWALMPNHVHLVVRSASVRISQLMARLGTGYARRFNERHDRVGHLFQNRFRSRRVVDDADLLGLVLYVTRNPLEARIVRDASELGDFPWCGLGALLGRRPPRAFESVAETLALFGDDRVRAYEALRDWLEMAAPAAPPAPAGEVVPCVAAPAAAASFEDLVRETCVRFGISTDELRSRRRNRVLAAARSALVHRAAGELGLSGAEIGRRLGVTPSGVHRMLGRAPAPTG